MLTDLAGAMWDLIRLGDPHGSVGRAVNRAARPRGTRRVTRSNVVAAKVKAVVGMQMTQRHGIHLTRVEVAVEGTHRAGTEVEEQREGPILVRRLHQVAGGWRVRPGQ